jgi:hypothetical protein
VCGHVTPPGANFCNHHDAPAEARDCPACGIITSRGDDPCPTLGIAWPARSLARADSPAAEGVRPDDHGQSPGAAAGTQ